MVNSGHRSQQTPCLMAHRPYLIYCAVAALSAVALPGEASAAAESDSGLPLFDKQGTLAVRIEGPLETMVRERSDKDYYDGRLILTDTAGGGDTALDLRFRTRGNFRRRRNICWFPPVRLNFKKKQTEGTEFEGQNKLKLVTHCHPTRVNFQRYVLREYLAYKILELHTPYSFRTRLLRITWVDTDNGGRELERYGFLIEHEDELADRLNATRFGENATRYEALNLDQAAIATIFQYLIANTDFSLIQAAPEEPCCHNAIVMVSNDDGGQYTVPYDFDFAGIVDAPYAAPSPNMRIRDVKQRLYRGSCAINPAVPAAVELFLARREAVLDTILTQEGLTARERERTARYVNRFYETIADPAAVEQTFIKGCL